MDVMPGMDAEAFMQYMSQRKEKLGERTMEQFCAGLLNKKLCMQFCKMAGRS